MKAPAPADEVARLAALYACEVLETPSEELFDAFTALAARFCRTPIALITLLDRDREWFKSAFEVARADAIGAHAILAERIFVVPDTRADPRFAGNRLVVGEPGVRFYAAVPLRSSDGYPIGTLAVIDRKPRPLEIEQGDALEALARTIGEMFEARRSLLRVFDSSHTELYQLDLATKRIVFVSDAARRNLGYATDELSALSLEALFPALTSDEELARGFTELRGTRTGRFTVRTSARRKDGTSYPIELRVERVPTPRRELAFAVATDLTDSELAQERIDLLSAAIEAAQDPILIVKPFADPDKSSLIVYANEAFMRQKGARTEDVIGKPTETFHGPLTDRSRLVHMRSEGLAGRPARVEYVAYRADGSHYYTESTVRPLVDEAGKTTHFVVVQRDVTETVLRGAQLTMQNERLTSLTSIARTLFAALEPTVLVGALLTGVRELVSGEATLYAPRPRDGFCATADLASHDDAPPGDTFIALASHSDVCVLDEGERRAAVRIPGSGGGTAYVLDVRRETPLMTADIFALGLLGQYFAVAARNVELYRELASRRDAVVELNQVKNDLIAMMAHDFKGPLTTIVGFADVLAEDERLDEGARQYLGMISSSALRLASLATDTLAISRLEQNELQLTLGEVDLADLARGVARVFSVTRPVDLRVGAGSMTVTGDAARLGQVLENLIGNAIKYSPGGEPVEVTLRSRVEAVEFSVRDRGIGIPLAERTKLFGRFARASNARALGIAGTGFGLYLSKTIVELHGGTIELASDEGQGSTFRVLVPVRPPHRRLGARRVVLLDGDGDARSYIAHALREDGFSVTVTTNAEELLRLLDDGVFDFVLVDAERLAGGEESFVARASGNVPLVRVGLRPPEPSQHGWDAYMTKPFLMKDLYDIVDTVLDQANGGRSSAAVSSAGSA
jgi:PAS domain S-box-containing protein